MRTRPPAPTDHDVSDAVPVVSTRKCGRCQQPFPGDPSLNFQTDWALCPPCSAKLLSRP
jgi:DNA-directed RNA polymerase subunit RPC12/RpoP